VPTVVHLCFRYAFLVSQQAEPRISFCRARRFGRAEISIEAAQPRSTPGVLKDLVGQTIWLGARQSRRPDRRTPRKVRGAHPRRIEVCVARPGSVRAPRCGMKYLGALKSPSASSRRSPMAPANSCARSWGVVKVRVGRAKGAPWSAEAPFGEGGCAVPAPWRARFVPPSRGQALARPTAVPYSAGAPTGSGSPVPPASAPCRACGDAAVEQADRSPASW